MRIILPAGLSIIYATILPATADSRLKSMPMPVGCEVDALRVCHRYGPTHLRLVGGGELVWHDDFVWDLETAVAPTLGNVYPLPVRAAND